MGDNNRMSVALHDYHMSTHNLSTIFRSTLGVGLLTPFVKFVAQKGDVFDIQLRNKTLTQPTLGPMFGTYKLQHFMFFAGFRLYNSWLHNNRTGIGLKMSDIKMPLMLDDNHDKNKDNKHNSSSLYSYLGWKGSRTSEKTGASTYVVKNGVPLLMYLDIFKNYFANTQEDNFYMVTANGIPNPLFSWNNGNQYNVNQDIVGGGLQSTTKIKILGNSNNWEKTWSCLQLTGTNGLLQPVIVPINELTSDMSTSEITLDKQNNSKIATVKQMQVISTELGTLLSTFGSMLNKFKLSGIDDIRDAILAKKGNEAFVLSASANYNGGADNEGLKCMTQIQKSQSKELGGLICKTYDSDLMNNWIKTETIDGENGIGAITAIDINANDGKLSLDTLNLQQKVYNMLNRIAVSGGTYRDWLQTVYTAGRYIDRPETPEFIGGMTQYINFQEISSTAATEGQPLGDIASIGRGSEPVNSGRIHYQCDEPGYIMGIVAITPMIDYSQGNDFDLNFETMDDLHKPALDGIGFQDLDEEMMHYATAPYNSLGTPRDQTHKSAGKTVAWIDYMTNYNRTYGKFAAGEELDFMVLNRRYETDAEGNITDLTTYIDPSKHIEIFADTDLTSQNFWVQTAIECTKRGNYSAKQIPTF